MTCSGARRQNADRDSAQRVYSVSDIFKYEWRGCQSLFLFTIEEWDLLNKLLAASAELRVA